MMKRRNALKSIVVPLLTGKRYDKSVKSFSQQF